VAVGQAPGLFLYTYLGTLGQLGLNIVRGRNHPRIIEYFFWGGGLLLSAVILIALGRVSLRLLQEAENKARALEMARAKEPAGKILTRQA
jgi:hypothetical protein